MIDGLRGDEKILTVIARDNNKDEGLPGKLTSSWA